MFLDRKKEGSISAVQNRDTVLPDYNTYVMSFKQKLFYTLAAAAALYAGAYLFYRSHLFSLLVSFLSLLYPRIKKKELLQRRKYELNIQFRDMLYALSSSLAGGKPIELAFRDILQDLYVLYPDHKAYIILETEFIIRRLEMNEPVESALEDFSKRAGLEDVRNFVDVFQTSKRIGGNIVEIIRNTSNIINDRIEIRQEIDTLLAERKFEGKVLNMLPMVMLAILSLAAEDYIRPVFTTPVGRLVMTVAILLLSVAYVISKKVMDIRI